MLRPSPGTAPAAARLALGTLSVLRVSPPARVDRGVAGPAMALAPLVGALVALPGAAVLLVVDALAGPDAALLGAALAVASGAAATRAIHLDGLADTADGLGSGRPAPAALEVMRRSDLGPFGAASLLLVLLAQVGALTALLDDGPAAAATALVAAGAVSRLGITLVCRPRWPAARADGLGSVVAATVTGRLLALALALTGAVLAALAAAGGPVLAAAAAPLGLAPALLLARRCRRRLGGTTGDVLGAVVETAATGALVAAALAV